MGILFLHVAAFSNNIQSRAVMINSFTIYKIVL